MFRVDNQYRIRTGNMATPDSYGTTGAFSIPNPFTPGTNFFCLVSDGLDWEHVSVSMRDNKDNYVNRCPTWEEMCFVKNIFWTDDTAVIQIHPKKEDYVNCHPYCLHLWKPIYQKIPVPPKILVGRN